MSDARGAGRGGEAPGGAAGGGGTGVTVRAATAADAQAVRALVAAMGRHDDVATHPGFDAVYLAALAEPSTRVVVGLGSGGTLAGAGSVLGVAAVQARSSVLHVAREAWLEALAVDPGVRGRGVGRALIAAVDRLAAELGCFEIVLESSVGRDAARRFYLGLGFEERTPAHRYRRAVGVPLPAPGPH